MLFGGLFLAEGPRVHSSGTLYLGDVLGQGGLYSYSPDQGLENVDDQCRNVGGSVEHVGGGIVYSTRRGLFHYDPVTRDISEIPVVVDGASVRNLNDSEADAYGNLFCGSLDYDAFDQGRAPNPGHVIVINTDGTAKKIMERPIPNGMEFGADGNRFYLSESGEGVFRYDLKDGGVLENRTLIAAMPDSDGICIDGAGGLWVARYLTNLVEYYSPDGKLARSIELPFESVASVTFGGADLLDLYVTGGSLKEPGKGGALKFRVEVAGPKPRKCALDLNIGRKRK